MIKYTWNSREKEAKGFEIWSCHQINEIPWTKKISNEIVLEYMKDKKTLWKTLE